MTNSYGGAADMNVLFCQRKAANALFNLPILFKFALVPSFHYVFGVNNNKNLRGLFYQHINLLHVMQYLSNVK